MVSKLGWVSDSRVFQLWIFANIISRWNNSLLCVPFMLAPFIPSGRVEMMLFGIIMFPIQGMLWLKFVMRLLLASMCLAWIYRTDGWWFICFLGCVLFAHLLTVSYWFWDGCYLQVVFHVSDGLLMSAGFSWVSVGLGFISADVCYLFCWDDVDLLLVQVPIGCYLVLLGCYSFISWQEVDGLLVLWYMR